MAVDHRVRRIDEGLLPTTSVLGNDPQDNRTILHNRGTVLEVASSVGYAQPIGNASVGLQYRRSSIDEIAFLYASDDRPNVFAPPPDLEGLLDDVNLFVNAALTPWRKLSLLAGGRLNYYRIGVESLPSLDAPDRQPESRLSPMGRLALLWAPTPPVSLKALYGRAFRLPTSFEMFAEFLSLISANARIKPEIQDTVELVCDAVLHETLILQANAFYNLISRTISLLASPVPGYASQYGNAPGKLTVYGVEANARWLPTPWISARGAVTWQRGHDDDKTQLDSMPALIAMGAVALAPTETVTLSARVKYTGSQFGLSDYATASAKAAWRATNHVALSVSALNVFGNRPKLPYFSGHPGRLTHSRALRLMVTVR
jgi:outer membrane receptor protein involved in Fe transport